MENPKEHEYIKDKFYIILNNGCKPKEELGFEADESVMLIRNFKVYQKN